MNGSDNSLKSLKLENWVMAKVESWREFYQSNFEDKHDEYYRIWRGIWSASDKTRESERSRLISPATQQAVESAVAEVEEATFGRGKFFDIKDERADEEKQDVMFLREQLHEDFSKTKIRKAIAESLLNAAVYGTGVAEIVIEEIKEQKPATKPIMDGSLMAYGVEINPRTVVKLRPIQPQNFLIDPVASSVDEALGVVIDEFVPIHTVEIAIKNGIYRDEDIETDQDSSLDKDKELSLAPSDKVRLTKYYGLVPRYLFDIAVNEPAEFENKEIEEGQPGYKAYEREEERREKAFERFMEGKAEEEIEEGDYVEAIVVIANGGTLLKVEENPYMMQDRPVIAFPWDVVPGMFWGRGIVEKGYNSQKALDAELRARVDALALTVHPMMAMDATRLPRGSKFEIKPGKAILTNGNPAEIMMPFKFGSVDQITFAQAGELQKMVQMATGAVDAAGIPGSINGEAAAGAVSMSLGAIIKRHKRTLINFQESFLIPFVEKAAWRYMQFDPEHYPIKDYNFIASSSLGVIAREYEVTQLVQLLQTVGQDSPIYPLLITAVIDNMGLANREEMIAKIVKLSEPNPEAQQAQQQSQMAQMAVVQADMQLKQAQAQKAQADAQKALVEAQLAPEEVKARMLSALSNNLNEDNEAKDFEKRVKMAELMLKEQDIASNERIAKMQVEAKQSKDQQFNQALGM